MHSLMETWDAPVWQCVCVPVISFLLPTPCLECVHASVHEFMSTFHHMIWSTPYDIIMERWVTHFPMSHSPWLWFTPCFECVHASVHEFMSTWLLMSVQPVCIV